MAGAAQPSYSLDGVDDASAAFILELQMADIDNLRSRLPGKQREGRHTDAELALQLASENLENLRSMISDRCMAQSIANAVQNDGEIMAAAVSEEDVATEDRVLAQCLDGNRPVPQGQACGDQETLDNSLLAKLAGRYLSEEKGIELLNSGGEQHANGESSTRRVQSGNATNNIDRQCTACGDMKKYFDVISGPCGHEYCRDCLHELFELSFTDESLFPPRCCRHPITIDSVAIFLTKSIKERFEERRIECDTPNRTYCTNSDCSRFIKAQDIEGDTAICTRCGTTTCTICKEATHDGDCPQDTALHAILDLANMENWQRCHGCRNIVQLEVGCNHITCRCGAQFCYVCGLQWKTCECVQWDEANLLARANIIVDREPVQQPNRVNHEPVQQANRVDHEPVQQLNRVDREPIQQPNRVERVQAAVEMLREFHDCVHGSWRFVWGANNCEECHGRLPRYLFECRQCQIRVCNRCKKNRLR